MSMIQNAIRTAYLIKDRRYYAVHRRFKNFTMIPPDLYVANLRLAITAASVPGAVVECGTWKGGMIAGIASLLGSDRDYYLFDSFEGLPPAESIDGIAAKQWQEATDAPGYFDNCTASEKDASSAMSLAGIKNAKLVKGWFENTLPNAKFPNGIAILRMDADWYKSTWQILDALFPLVNKDGLIIIDDYYIWDGCSRAVHDYLSKMGRSERISSFKEVAFIKKQDKI